MVQPVDRLDGQLIGDQFADERQGLVGGIRTVTVRATSLVPVRAADAVAMMTIGDEDVLRADLGGDRLDPCRVGDPLDDVLDTVDGDVADRLGGLGQQVGEALGE